jgi:integrase
MEGAGLRDGRSCPPCRGHGSGSTGGECPGCGDVGWTTGKRTVSFPAEIAPEIRWHLERFAEPGERGFVFLGPKGGQLRRSNFHKSVWIKARQKVGLPGLHFHDLRHTGGTRTAAAGTTLKELMARLGHSASARR